MRLPLTTQLPMLTIFILLGIWWVLSSLSIRTHGARTTLLDLPNELLLMVAENLGPRFRDLNSLLRTSRFFERLLSPVLLGRTIGFRDRSGRSLLHWASSNGRDSLVILLLKRGALPDVNIPDRRRETALHSAVLCGHVMVVKILLQNGADTKIMNRDGWTPLHLAAVMGNRVVVALLLESGADIDSRSRTLFGKTAMHYAALLGYVDVAKLLMEQGAGIGTIDDIGMAIVQSAEAASHDKIVRLLLDSGGLEMALSLSVVPSDHMYYMFRAEVRAIKRDINMLFIYEACSRKFYSSN